VEGIWCFVEDNTYRMLGSTFLTRCDRAFLIFITLFHHIGSSDVTWVWKQSKSVVRARNLSDRSQTWAFPGLKRSDLLSSLCDRGFYRVTRRPNDPCNYLSQDDCGDKSNNITMNSELRRVLKLVTLLLFSWTFVPPIIISRQPLPLSRGCFDLFPQFNFEKEKKRRFQYQKLYNSKGSSLGYSAFLLHFSFWWSKA
jgi:hypothetical protein